MTTLDVPASGAADRRGGLIAWGVVLIVLGTILSLFLIGSLVGYLGLVEQDLLGAPAAGQRRGGARPAAPQLDFLAGIGIVAMALVTAGLLWTGIASCLGRRWVRPVIMIFCVAIIVTGLMEVVTTLLSIPHLLERVDERFFQQRAAVPTSGAVLTVILIRLGLSAAFMVVLPWFMFRFYASDRTRSALDELDPRRLWTDRLPVAALGWTCFAGFVGLFLLASAKKPILPAFGTLLTGTSAVVVSCVLGVALVWSATLCFRGERAGWATSFVLLVVARLATAVYFWMGGAPVNPAATTAEEVQLLWNRNGALVPEWLPALMATLDSVVVALFGLYVARYFRGGYRFGLLRDRSDATAAQ
jgi:hypothetical protein